MFAHTHIHTNKTKKKNLHAKRESIKISSHLIPKHTFQHLENRHTHILAQMYKIKLLCFVSTFFVQFLFINMRSITSPPVRQSGWLSVSQPEYIEGAIGFSHPSIHPHLHLPKSSSSSPSSSSTPRNFKYNSNNKGEMKWNAFVACGFWKVHSLSVLYFACGF